MIYVREYIRDKLVEISNSIEDIFIELTCLTHFTPVSHFYTKGFLTFSEVIEM